jgi:hypothetical protein
MQVKDQDALRPQAHDQQKNCPVNFQVPEVKHLQQHGQVG